MERPSVRVFKWGNDLAVLLPDALAEALGRKEGDEVEIEVAGDRAREAALERLRAL